jgi:hypothetical protein
VSTNFPAQCVAYGSTKFEPVKPAKRAAYQRTVRPTQWLPLDSANVAAIGPAYDAAKWTTDVAAYCASNDAAVVAANSSS